MHPDTNDGAGVVAATAASGRPLELPGWGGGALVARDHAEREDSARRARDTDAGRQLAALLRALAPRRSSSCAARALRAAGAQPSRSTPTTPTRGSAADAHAEAVLRRHGITRVNAGRLQLRAVRALIDGQAQADREAGLDWTTVTAPAAPARRRAARAPTRGCRSTSTTRRAGSRAPTSAARSRAGSASRGQQADELSRWALAHPDAFDADDLRCWRIASARWLALADEQLAPVGRVERPVGVFLAPAAAAAAGSCIPVLSLDAIRLLAALGGSARARPARRRRCPRTATTELLERLNPQHAARRPERERRLGRGSWRPSSRASSARRVNPGRAARPASTAGAACSCAAAATRPGRQPSAPSSRCASSRSPRRRFPRRRLGAAPLDELLRAAERGRWSSARRCRPRSSTACRCCCPARPPASSRTPSASGA